MRQMKDSGIAWIGEIPYDWESKRLKYLVSYNDDVLDEKTDDDFEFDYIDIGSVEYGKGIAQFQHMRYADAPSRARRIVKKGDVILSTVRTYLKAVATISDSDIPQIVSTGFAVLRANENEIHPSFLNYAVLSNAFISTVEARSVGISYPAINASDVVTIAIPVPTLSEQQRIATFLDAECARIDAVIEQTRVSIEEYKKLKQSVITQAVTKGIRPGRKMKDSGIEWIGEIPEEWENTTLKRYCTFQNGSTPSTTNNEWFDGKLEWFTPGDFSERPYLSNSTRKLSEKAKEDGVATIIPADTVVVVGIGGTAGKVGFTTSECSCNQQVTALIEKRPLYSRFLMYWMIANTKFLRETALYTTLPIINNQTIGEYLLLVPNDMGEQIEIADYLDDKVVEIDALIAKKEQLQVELESYKKSLIFEYVAGKKEVV